MAPPTLILVAGLPGTGKTHLSRLIADHVGNCEQVCLDQIKERLWDQVGFQGPQEKAAIDQRALKVFFQEVGAAMGRSRVVLSDYPFSSKQGPALAALCARHGFTPLTVRLVADLDVLYERQRLRDLNSSRHLGHILTSYRPGDQLTERQEADGLLTREELRRRCTTRGYGSFALGEVLEVDMSDFDAVDQPVILAWLDEHMRD